MNFRKDKTKKDKASGAHARHLSNIEERTSWMRNKRGHHAAPLEFPKHTCNGKRNRVARSVKK